MTFPGRDRGRAAASPTHGHRGNAGLPPAFARRTPERSCWQGARRRGDRPRLLPEGPGTARRSSDLPNWYAVAPFLAAPGAQIGRAVASVLPSDTRNRMRPARRRRPARDDLRRRRRVSAPRGTPRRHHLCRPDSDTPGPQARRRIRSAQGNDPASHGPRHHLSLVTRRPRALPRAARGFRFDLLSPVHDVFRPGAVGFFRHETSTREQRGDGVWISG